MDPGTLEGFFSRGGGRFKWDFTKRFYSIDLFPNTLYRKCIEFVSLKWEEGGGGGYL